LSLRSCRCAQWPCDPSLYIGNQSCPGTETVVADRGNSAAPSKPCDKTDMVSWGRASGDSPSSKAAKKTKSSSLGAAAINSLAKQYDKPVKWRLQGSLEQRIQAWYQPVARSAIGLCTYSAVYVQVHKPCMSCGTPAVQKKYTQPDCNILFLVKSGLAPSQYHPNAAAVTALCPCHQGTFRRCRHVTGSSSASRIATPLAADRQRFWQSRLTPAVTVCQSRYCL